MRAGVSALPIAKAMLALAFVLPCLGSTIFERMRAAASHSACYALHR